MASLDKRDEKVDLPGPLPRGFLDRARAADLLRVRRYPPAAGLGHVIDNHFIIEWSLPPGRSEQQRLLPSPQVNLVVAPNSALVFGVHTGLRVDVLHGSGRVVGSRFRIGGLRPYLEGAVTRLTERSTDARLVSGIAEAELISRLARTPDDESAISALTAILAACVPPPDPKIDLVEAMVRAMRVAGGPMRVETIAAQFSVTLRQVQRLFHDYVGVPPKWVIRRYRLQETALQLAAPDPANIASIAAELGYFDQAHLTRDFRALFGCSPSAYRASHGEAAHSG